jgi:hypothetical protein
VERVEKVPTLRFLIWITEFRARMPRLESWGGMAHAFSGAGVDGYRSSIAAPC